MCDVFWILAHHLRVAENNRLMEISHRGEEWHRILDKLQHKIKNSYKGTGCRVIHSGELTKHFKVKTGVKQGCLLSPFLFLLVINWIMKICIKGEKSWNPVDTKYTTWRPGLCQRPSTVVPQPSTDAEEDKWTGSHLFTSGVKYT